MFRFPYKCRLVLVFISRKWVLKIANLCCGCEKYKKGGFVIESVKLYEKNKSTSRVYQMDIFICVVSHIP